MDKMKRFVDCYIDTETCNFKCHYCYIAQKNRFSKKITKLKHSKEEIRKALSKDRMGGICLINLCAGGETLLSDDIVPLIEELLKEGHYVMVVTNGSFKKRFKQIVEIQKDLLERLFFKFSFHYLELIRLNLMEQFFSNINLVRNAGCSFTLEVTPSDELISHIDDVIKISNEKLGAPCQITIARDDRTKGIEILSEHNFEDYKKIWSKFNSDLFDYKKDIFYKKRKEFCYAGDWSIYLNLSTGDVFQCYNSRVIDNIYKDINKPIKFEAIGANCPMAHCYNGHAYLALGDIPELDAPTYSKLRNRIDENGNEWLSEKMKFFMEQKLYENNIEYNEKQKTKIDRYYKLKLLTNKSTRLAKKVVRKMVKK